MTLTAGKTTVSHAVIQAMFLRAIAGHLSTHHHLPPINIQGDQLLLQAHRTDTARGLAQWAETLGNVTVTVQDIYGEAYVFVDGTIFTYEVCVWGVVEGLLEVLGDVNHFPPGRQPVAPEVLRAYAGMSGPYYSYTWESRDEFRD